MIDQPDASNMDVRENRFLEGFSPAGRDRLVGYLTYQDLGAGEYLFREDDPADGVCLVLEGEVEILRTAGDGEHILTSIGAGDFLGEVAVLDGHGRSTDARAREATGVAWIPRNALLEVLVTEPVTLTLHLFQNVLAVLRQTNDLYIEEAVRKKKLSLIGEMAGSLMHDLRNPVTAIQLAADLVKMDHSDEETVRCCETIRLQCDRVMAMAEELLEFSRGEARLHLESTDTTVLVQRFLAFNDDSSRPPGLKFTILAEPAEIEIDSMRLLRVLQNLVANAVDAVNSRPDGRLDVRVWVRDGILHLTVRDNGSGIPAQIRDRLFEPFVTHGKTGGTGLGLAIVLNVVAAHRGKISVETEGGQGTEFLIRIPQDAAGRPVE
jgi:signal transduction histidine kinase